MVRHDPFHERINITMIKVFKLVNGEEILAKIENLDIRPYKIEQPVKIIATPEGKLAMAPWMFLSDDKSFEIKSEHILCVAEPSNEIKNAYNSQFGTGIVTPPRNIVTG